MASLIAHVVPVPLLVSSPEQSLNLKFPRSSFRNQITSLTKNDAKRLRAYCVFPSLSNPLNNLDSENSIVSCEGTIERLRGILMSTTRKNRFEGLEMIDAIQRLGIDHHFRYEIDEILRNLYEQGKEYGYYGHDLREVALCFRLLRQEGYHVPQSVFDAVRDKDGQFKEELQKDMMGMIELFEASQLSVEGEETLDNANDFVVKRLKEHFLARDSRQGQVILHVLGQPHHKTLSRLTTKRFISMINTVGGKKEWLKSLQSVAEDDFKTFKSLHQEEISQTFKWWRELGLANKLWKARDQPLKWHTWSMAILQDHGLSEQRLDLTKSISMIYVLDDIFDVYGGLEELTTFTQVMERWDYDGLEKLTSHMKEFFKALNMITMEISLKVYQKYGWNPIDSIRKSWGRLCNAFLVEAKWFDLGCLPSKEEYLENGILSSGVPLVMLHVFFLLGEEITRERVELMESNPNIVSSAATILRLWDDLGSAKDEKQDGFDGSYIECYMNQHEGSTIEEARTHVLHMISNAWKCLNEECLNPNPFSRSSFSKACLNLARTVPMMYCYDDDHRLPRLEEYLKSLN